MRKEFAKILTVFTLYVQPSPVIVLIRLTVCIQEKVLPHCFGQQASMGVQNESPQDVPLWNAECFVLKATLAYAADVI